MIKYLQNIGLEGFDNKESLEELIKYSLINGYAVEGYENNPYVNMHCGAAEIVLSTQKDCEGKYKVVGLNPHACGEAVWKIRVLEEINRENKKNTMEKQLLVGKGDSYKGMTVVNVVNSDVLPSFLEGDIYELQMMAFADTIDYFEDEDTYAKTLPKDDLGRSFGIANGCVFPSGLLGNQSRRKKKIGETLIRGVVKGFKVGRFEIGDEDPFSAFVYCAIDTEFGPLQIVHTIDQVKEEQKQFLKVGSTVVTRCVLSGDAAIYEYEKGIVRNEEQNLKAIRYMLRTGNANRLASILADDVVYVSDLSGRDYEGAECVIDRLNYVYEETTHEYYGHMATITIVKEDGLPYENGKRCVVLASDEPDNYESILFIECDESGKIEKLHTCANSNYMFRIDVLPIEESDYEKDMDEEESTCVHRMYMRAKSMTFLEDIEEDILYTEDADHENESKNIKSFLETVGNTDDMDDDTRKNLFGYVFAKAIEIEYSKRKNENIEYSERAIFDGEYDSQCEGVHYEKLKVAMKYGRDFYNDFKNHVTRRNLDYKEELQKALFMVQRIGRYSAEEYMERVIEK